MLLRMRLFLSSIVGTFVLLLMLCLGSQNLSERSVVNLLVKQCLYRRVLWWV